MKILSSKLSIEKKDNVCILWLNRAEKYNALSSDLWGGIPDALNEIMLDDDINAIAEKITIANTSRSFNFKTAPAS